MTLGKALCAVLVVVAVVVAPVRAGASGSATVRSHLLALGELPAGWAVNLSSPRTSVASGRCLQGLAGKRLHDPEAFVSFADGGNIPVLEEALTMLPAPSKARTVFRRATKALDSCHSLVFGNVRSRIRAMSFPREGTASAAYVLTVAVTKFTVGFDIVAIQVARYAGVVAYGAVGTPRVATVEQFVKAAVDKIEGKPVHLTTAGRGSRSATPA